MLRNNSNNMRQPIKQTKLQVFDWVIKDTNTFNKVTQKNVVCQQQTKLQAPVWSRVTQTFFNFLNFFPRHFLLLHGMNKTKRQCQTFLSTKERMQNNRKNVGKHKYPMCAFTLTIHGQVTSWLDSTGKDPPQKCSLPIPSLLPAGNTICVLSTLLDPCRLGVR